MRVSWDQRLVSVKKPHVSTGSGLLIQELDFCCAARAHPCPCDAVSTHLAHGRRCAAARRRCINNHDDICAARAYAAELSREG